MRRRKRRRKAHKIGRHAHHEHFSQVEIEHRKGTTVTREIFRSRDGIDTRVIIEL